MPSTPSRPRLSTPSGLILALALSLMAAPANAGSITEESIISESAARQQAIDRVPSNASVVTTRCQEIGMPGGTFRYRCTVEYATTPGPQGDGPATLDPQQPAQDQP